MQFELILDGHPVNLNFYALKLLWESDTSKARYSAVAPQRHAFLKHDYIPAYSAIVTRCKNEEPKWQGVLSHSVYISDLAPSDYDDIFLAWIEVQQRGRVLK